MHQHYVTPCLSFFQVSEKFAYARPMGFSVPEGLKLNSKVSDKAKGKEGTYYWRAAIENVKSSIALPLSHKEAGGTSLYFSHICTITAKTCLGQCN